MSGLPKPVGAIWISGRGESHSLSVKLNEVVIDGRVVEIRSKHIAVRNFKKRNHTQPDYFLHVYQEDTGSAPVSPFGVGGAKAQGEAGVV